MGELINFEAKKLERDKFNELEKSIDNLYQQLIEMWLRLYKERQTKGETNETD